MRAEGSVVSCRGQQDRQGDDIEATLSSHMMEQPVPWRKEQGYDLDMGNIYLGVWGSILTQEERILLVTATYPFECGLEVPSEHIRLRGGFGFGKSLLPRPDLF